MALKLTTEAYITGKPHNGVDIKEPAACVTYKDTSKYDENDLPNGIGAFVEAYATYRPHEGVDVSSVDVYVTYRDTSKYNPNEGQDASIKAITEAYITGRPHNGVDIKDPEAYVTYRDTSKYDEDDLPYGLGAVVEAYFTYRPFSAEIYNIQNIAIGDTLLNIMQVRAVNEMLIGKVKAIKGIDIYKDIEEQISGY